METLNMYILYTKDLLQFFVKQEINSCFVRLDHAVYIKNALYNLQLIILSEL